MFGCKISSKHYLLHSLLVLVRALDELVKGDCVLLELSRVVDVWDMQPVQGHEGDAPLAYFVQLSHKLQAHTVIINHNLACTDITTDVAGHSMAHLTKQHNQSRG